jgi:hypothetical protein
MMPISACANKASEALATRSSQTRDYTGGEFVGVVRCARLAGYNFSMRFGAGCVLLLVCLGGVQDKAARGREPMPVVATAVTVPAVIDHNRIIVGANIRLPDGTMQRIHAWVDSGNADLEMSRRLATLLALKVACDDKACSAPPPVEIIVGGIKLSLTAVKEAKIPLKPPSAAAVLAAGMDAEINLPATVLRQYDVLIDFPGQKFTIGAPGSVHFLGSSGKVQISTDGLIQVPAKIENKKYNLALDVGSSISFLSAQLFDQLAAAHTDWPHMTGAIASANMWGADDELKWKLMRVDRVQFGPLFLTDVAMVDFPKDWQDFFEKRAGMPTAGLIGSQALLNYRVGIDYAHAIVYFDIGRLFNFPDFDAAGLILRPEDDGRFTILGAADFNGEPSVSGVEPGDSLMAVNEIAVRGSTMGQVWAMLRGTPGQERRLLVEREGKQVAVVARVQHFLGMAEESTGKKKK